MVSCSGSESPALLPTPSTTVLTKEAIPDSFTAWCITPDRLVDGVARMVVDCGAATMDKTIAEGEAGA